MKDLGANRPRRAPRTGSIPALYLSMIAVDGRRQGRGSARTLRSTRWAASSWSFPMSSTTAARKFSHAGWSSIGGSDSSAWRTGRNGCSSRSARYGPCSARDDRDFLESVHLAGRDADTRQGTLLIIGPGTTAMHGCALVPDDHVTGGTTGGCRYGPVPSRTQPVHRSAGGPLSRPCRQHRRHGRQCRGLPPR